MKSSSSASGEDRCAAISDWLGRRPLQDNPQMLGAAASSSVTWDEWVAEGRRTPDAEACLLELLDKETNPVTRSAGVIALGQVGSGRVIARLIDLLNDKYTMVAMEAAAALGHVGDSTAVPPLIAALKNSDPNVRANACQALGTLGGAEAAAALADARRDSNPFVRSAAEEALARVRR